MKKLLFSACLLIAGLSISAQDIKLPDPVKTGGKPLFEALNDRQTIKDYTGSELNNQELSNLLWSAYGFNREDKRTVPSSQNRQEIDVYVVLSNGVYFYDAKENVLKLHTAGDQRATLGQPAVSEKAALTLVYVANLDKASNREAGFIDTGFIAQNVYLFAASNGYGVVARGSFKRPDVHNMLKLSDKQEVTLVQALGVVK